MRFEQKLLEPILFERFNIWLTDVRDGNCGLSKDGKLKLFDFGISSTTDLDSYGSFQGSSGIYPSTLLRPTFLRFERKVFRIF